MFLSEGNSLCTSWLTVMQCRTEYERGEKRAIETCKLTIRDLESSRDENGWDFSEDMSGLTYLLHLPLLP